MGNQSETEQTHGYSYEKARKRKERSRESCVREKGKYLRGVEDGKYSCL